MTEPDQPDASGEPVPEGSPQPPFPFVLIALTAAAGWAAITTEAGWMKISAVVGVVLFASAALYQSRTVKEPTDDTATDDPWDGQVGDGR